MSMNIPLVDLKSQYRSIKENIDTAIKDVIEQTAFIGGHYVKEFEKEFAQLYGVKHVISCANGTDSLYIIMKMLGIGTGDEVITVANSWISSAETIGQTGATPVFIDVHPDYFSIDDDQIEKVITPRTKAIILVHLQGQSCDLDKIEKICKDNNIYLIEDCAQSHFSEYKGRRAGTVGIAGSFSFYPGKTSAHMAMPAASLPTMMNWRHVIECMPITVRSSSISMKWKGSTAGWTACRRQS
jgi:dTDP-4-amino-4,6-dideoxygalactose transaminase